MQKFNIIHNHHYKLIQSNYTQRTNRDRPGGHVCSQIVSQGWKDYCGSSGRKFAKNPKP